MSLSSLALALSFVHTLAFIITVCLFPDALLRTYKADAAQTGMTTHQNLRLVSALQAWFFISLWKALMVLFIGIVGDRQSRAHLNFAVMVGSGVLFLFQLADLVPSSRRVFADAPKVLLSCCINLLVALINGVAWRRAGGCFPFQTFPPFLPSSSAMIAAFFQILLLACVSSVMLLDTPAILAAMNIPQEVSALAVAVASFVRCMAITLLGIALYIACTVQSGHRASIIVTMEVMQLMSLAALAFLVAWNSALAAPPSFLLFATCLALTCSFVLSSSALLADKAQSNGKTDLNAEMTPGADALSKLANAAVHKID